MNLTECIANNGEKYDDEKKILIFKLYESIHDSLLKLEIADKRRLQIEISKLDLTHSEIKSLFGAGTGLQSWDSIERHRTQKPNITDRDKHAADVWMCYCKPTVIRSKGADRKREFLGIRKILKIKMTPLDVF